MKQHGKNTISVYDYDKDGDLVVTAAVPVSGPKSFVSYFTTEELKELTESIKSNKVSEANLLFDIFNSAELDGSMYFDLPMNFTGKEDIEQRRKDVYSKFDSNLFDITKIVSINLQLLTCIHPKCEDRREENQKSICIIIKIARTVDTRFIFCTSCTSFSIMNGYISPSAKLVTNDDVRFEYLTSTNIKLIDGSNIKATAEIKKRGADKVIITGSLAEKYLKAQEKKAKTYRGKNR